MAGVPPSATVRRVGERGYLGDLSGAKVKRYEGSVAKSLSIEIVHVVFALLSDNARAFLQECQARAGSPSWIASARGPRPTWAALSRNRFIFFVENRNSFSF